MKSFKSIWDDYTRKCMTLEYNLKCHEIVQILWSRSYEHLSDAHQGITESHNVIFHFPSLKASMRISKAGQNSHWKWNISFRLLINRNVLSYLHWAWQRCCEIVWIAEEERKFGAVQKISPICTDIQLLLEFLMILLLTYFFISKEDSCSIASQI